MSREKLPSEFESILDGSRDLSNPETFLATAVAIKDQWNVDRNDVRVQKVLKLLQDAQNKINYVELVKLCLKDNEKRRAETVRGFLYRKELPSCQAIEIVDELLNCRAAPSLIDQLLGAIIVAQDVAQSRLAESFTKQPSKLFTQLWELGEKSVGALLWVLQKPVESVWKTESARNTALKDAFTLFLAKVLEPGLDRPEIPMKCVARLLATEASKLESLVDTITYQTILTFLRHDSSPELRSQATLVVAKILEVSPTRAQRLIADFVINRVASKWNDDLFTAFSVASAIFPVAPTMAAGLFLTEGFVADLEKIISSSKTSKVIHSGLELLNAACIDRTCREAISKQCSDWLQDLSYASDGKTSALAGLILAKTQEMHTVDGDELFSLFRSHALKTNNDVNCISVEGLAFISIQPAVKEALSRDPEFLRDLADTLGTQKDGQLRFGILTTFSNMTQYPTRLTPDEKRMAQLRAYANKVKVAETHPLESEEKVSNRCSKCIDANLVPSLIKCNKSTSVTSNDLISKIVLSLAKHPRHRSKLAQQGVVNLLLDLSSCDKPNSGSVAIDIRRNSALALAQILIPIDPSLIFSEKCPATNALRPLRELLKERDSSDEDSSGGVAKPYYSRGDNSIERQLYAAREALKALTNLAAMGSETTNSIVSLSWDDIEGYLTSDVHELRLAAMQLIGNLCEAEGSSAINKLALEGHKSIHRLRILVALLKGELLAIQLSAAAALVWVMRYEAGIKTFLALDNGIQDLVEVLHDISKETADKRDDLVYRITIIINELIDEIVPEEERTEAILRFKRTDVRSILGELGTKMRTGDSRAAVEMVLSHIK